MLSPLAPLGPATARAGFEIARDIQSPLPAPTSVSPQPVSLT